jgi:UDP-2-acetamido-2-deoxy-ribo-hexuluronate aminotransferase
MSSSSTLPFINLKAQYAALKSEIDARIQRVLDHGQYIMGPEVRELEATLEMRSSIAHCITVSSGTEALLISLMALGIGLGDEVVTSPFTFAATAEVIALAGATPVFVDVEPETGNIDAELIEAAVTERTRAILPVSLYGQPADMEKINRIAKRHGLAVIEDAAQSYGAQYKGVDSGALSTFGCVSFFPSKPLGCYGDGGAIFTADAELAKIAREIRAHGQSQRYVHSRIGVGGRMDTIQCAIVLAKLERFNWEITQRLQIGQRYNAMFDDAGQQRILQRDDRTSVFAQYTVLVDNREAAVAHLTRLGIPTAVHYPIPLNRQVAYASLSRGGPTPVADDLAARVLSLPMHPDLDLQTQRRIVNALQDAVA